MQDEETERSTNIHYINQQAHLYERSAFLAIQEKSDPSPPCPTAKI